MATRYDDYMNRRSWMVDTAETPQQKKALPKELSKLDKAVNWASRSSAGLQGKAGKAVAKLYKTY